MYRKYIGGKKITHIYKDLGDTAVTMQPRQADHSSGENELSKYEIKGRCSGVIII